MPVAGMWGGDGGGCVCIPFAGTAAALSLPSVDGDADGGVGNGSRALRSCSAVANDDEDDEEVDEVVVGADEGTEGGSGGSEGGGVSVALERAAPFLP